MPIEELWALHGEIAKLLQTKIIAEKQELERRLTNLHGSAAPAEVKNRTPAVSGSVSQISKSRRADRDLVRSRQTAEMDSGAIKVRQDP